jgi:elongation factor P
MQFLYDDGDFHIFMDNITYEQLNVMNELMDSAKHFLKGGMNVDLLFDGEEVLDIRLPAHVKLEVSHTEPGVKGNTATGATKPATLETNYTVNVPLFVEEGDVLKVDTRSGEYIERVKS